MDEKKRAALIERMGEVKTYNGGMSPVVMPLMPLEQYFDGAEGEAHMLPNTDSEPDDAAVLEVFRTIRERSDVFDVRIAIVQCDDDQWPFSDKVVVVTTADAETVRSWLPECFEPDECWEDAVADLSAEDVPRPPGYRMIWLWYD